MSISGTSRPSYKFNILLQMYYETLKVRIHLEINKQPKLLKMMPILYWIRS